jgi:ribonucleoside-diphosphate reductase beta chain
MSYINKMFEMGDIENLTAYDLQHFIKKRVGDKLEELGYTERKYKQWDWTEKSYDQKAINKMAWFDHLTGGHTHTDFFAIRPTDYSKANEGEDFEDVW